MQDDRIGVLIVAVADAADPLGCLPEPDGATGLLLGLPLAAGWPPALAEPGWALVRGWTSGHAPAPAWPHGTGCACCQGRAPLAVLLSDLFQQRVRGQLPLFRRLLLAVAADEVAATREVLLGDRLVAGRYRVLDQPAAARARKMVPRGGSAC